MHGWILSSKSTVVFFSEQFNIIKALFPKGSSITEVGVVYNVYTVKVKPKQQRRTRSNDLNRREEDCGKVKAAR